MKNDLTIIAGTRIALFRSIGPIKFENRMKNIERIARFCNRNNIKHLIVDISQQISDAGTTQMFELGRSVPVVLKGIKIAIVCQASDGETQFGETVAANRGALSRSFTNIEEAQRWLEGKDVTPNIPDAEDA